MKITIFGTGYVGLVTGTCLAEVGHEVLCIDIDQQKINNLENGIIPIYEPGLEELVARNYKNRRLSFSTDPKYGVEYATVIFSAVGTPPDENHRADLKFVKAVAQTLGQYMTEYKVFVNKSTVPVGTGDMCRDIIEQELKIRNITRFSPGFEGEMPERQTSEKQSIATISKLEQSRGLFDIVSNPEFLREGTAVKDFMVPDRIVCGVDSETAKQVMSEVYAPFSRSYVNMIWTSIASAEIAKYAANAFLATKLSFINEIANFAEISGGNIREIARAIGSDARIGNKFLHAGIGYGGSCFPKDVDALIETGKDHNFDFQIIRATESVNKSQQLIPIKKLEERMDISGKHLSIWGLSFKPKTDDIREAPSLAIIDSLLQKGASQISVYDPVSMDHVREMYKTEAKIKFHANYYDCLSESDALIIVTEWDEFRGADKEKILEKMSGNCIIDGRNIWSAEDFAHLDCNYVGIGIATNSNS